MTSEGLGEVLKGDSADMCAEKFPLVSMGGRADQSSLCRRGARDRIGASENCMSKFHFLYSELDPVNSFSGYEWLCSLGDKVEFDYLFIILIYEFIYGGPTIFYTPKILISIK